MYKITLYDYNCCSICDGTTFWFVDDLEEFEKNWLPLQCRYNVSTIERYYRSKSGEIVTDYYSDSPELNIVQKVDCEILQEKELKYTNKEVVLKNRYNWDDRGKEDAYKDFYTNDKSFYEKESVQTFVWLPIKKVDKDFSIKKFTKGDLSVLLADTVGEAG